jgi:hypothetical protein
MPVVSQPICCIEGDIPRGVAMHTVWCSFAGAYHLCAHAGGAQYYDWLLVPVGSRHSRCFAIVPVLASSIHCGHVRWGSCLSVPCTTQIGPAPSEPFNHARAWLKGDVVPSYARSPKRITSTMVRVTSSTRLRKHRPVGAGSWPVFGFFARPLLRNVYKFKPLRHQKVRFLQIEPDIQ